MNTTIDWPALLADVAYLLGEPEVGTMRRTPCGTRDLAKHLGIPRMTVVGWIDGSRPRWDEGELLLSRWSALTGKAREYAPRTKVVYSAAKVG